MSRISIEKKEETQRKILSVSKKLFLGNGYYKTSIKQIAAEVGIAEGTIFNYYPSKADIFLNTMDDGYFNGSSIDFSRYDLSLPAIEIMMQYVTHELNILLTIPKKVLIELGTAILGNAISKTNIVNQLILIDKNYVERLIDFISYLKGNGLVKDCDARLIGECIFDVVFMELFIYLNIQDRTKEDVIKKTKEKITVIIRGIE